MFDHGIIRFPVSLIALLLLSLQAGCSTVQLATVPNGPQAYATITHCLVSLGLHDDSRKSINQSFMDTTPRLHAIWSTPTSSGVSAAPDSMVFVERKGADQLQLRFVPGAGQESAAAAFLAHAFKTCVSEHTPGMDVVLTGKSFIDIR